MTVGTVNPQYQDALAPLRPEELAALKADIERRGVMHAVDLDEDGQVLDGHHRVAIADELGIDYPTVTHSFDSEADRLDWVIKSNLCRRHLDPIRWGHAFDKLLAHRGVKRGQGARNGTSATVAEVAAEAGVSPRTARWRLRQADKYTELPAEHQQRVDGGEDLADVVRDHQKAEREAERVRLAAAAVLPAGGDEGVRLGDFRHAEVEAGSVKLIFTDPPYSPDVVGLFRDLFTVAEAALEDGGSLVTYFGRCAIRAVFAAIPPGMRVHWLCGVQHSGPCDLMKQYGVRVRFKPLLWLTKGHRSGMCVVDDLIVGDHEKALHPWQQAVSEAAYYIERLTKPDDLVFDPFGGSATTAVACKQLRRRWLLCEVDPDTAALARQRIREFNA